MIKKRSAANGFSKRFVRTDDNSGETHHSMIKGGVNVTPPSICRGGLPIGKTAIFTHSPEGNVSRLVRHYDVHCESTVVVVESR